MLNQRPSRDDVTHLYRKLLGREPENESVVSGHAKVRSYKQLVANITDSDEFVRRTYQSPFFFYNSSFDAEAVIRRHAQNGLASTAGLQTNFMGLLIDPKYSPEALKGTAGTVEHIPIPANWHADIAEWTAVLRSVELAHDTFRMVELGCGWGCWINNAGLAARKHNLKLDLIGAEADAEHIKFAQESTSLNGFKSDEVRLVRGIIHASSGYALFPKQDVGGSSYGLAPVFDADIDQRAQLLKSGSYEELPMIGLKDLIGQDRTIDLLHIDIQGGEADFISACTATLLSSVKYVVVGTHSREIEGRLFAMMSGAGWRLEIERPAIISLRDDERFVVVDGVQGWRNMALLPSA